MMVPPLHMIPKSPYQFLPVEGGDLAWWEEGTGSTTIVWVHGLPLDSTSWEYQRQHFTKRCRNVFVDLRGYGRSSKLPEHVADVTQLYCDDLAKLLREVVGQPAVLVGFASAGHVALRLAAQHPETLCALVTINGSPRFRRGADWPWGFTDEGIAHFTAPLHQGGVAAMADALLAPDTVFRDVSLGTAKALDAWFRPMALDAGGSTLLGFFDGISRDDDRSYLPDIGAPVLLICSRAGLEVPSEVSLYMRQSIPQAQLIELAGVDHFAFATRPELINATLEGFIFHTNN